MLSIYSRLVNKMPFELSFFDDLVERILQINPLTGELIKELDFYRIYPGSHYVTPKQKLDLALKDIEKELESRLKFFKSNNKLLEAQRLEQRTNFDLEILKETGFVKGIENYSRYLTNREPGEQPATLLDYFPDDFLLLIDESHMTLPQIRGMYNGDRARKEVLVEHGFRLPSALDNRPLTFKEFNNHINKVIYISATPSEYELSRSKQVVEQVIRPTGLLDPEIEVRKSNNQVDDLINEIALRVKKHQRILITTLTKRMAEDLTTFLENFKIKVAYLHSEIDTLDRTDIIRDLRSGVYDVLVGINLLREGLDLPEVSLVAILDADKEGFLRSEQALIQIIGRAARHQEGKVIMYADKITDSMSKAIDITNSRRSLQKNYNKEHGIIPKSIVKKSNKVLIERLKDKPQEEKLNLKKIPKEEYPSLIASLISQMELESANLRFEEAAKLRDLINQIKKEI